jgi:hypothetical protein
MTNARIVSLVLGGAVAGLLLGAGPAPAQDAELLSSRGRTVHITRPGSYRLGHNLKLTGGGVAVVISAGGVSLDLGGHALIGPGGKQGTGVLVQGGHDVSVRNGTIQGFAFGVQVVNAFNVRIQGLQITGEDGGGPPPGEVGIMILNSRGVEAFRNVISRVFLGVFVRGGGSVATASPRTPSPRARTASSASATTPDGLTPPDPRDLVYSNLVSGSTSASDGPQSAGTSSARTTSPSCRWRSRSCRRGRNVSRRTPRSASTDRAASRSVRSSRAEVLRRPRFRVRAVGGRGPPQASRRRIPLRSFTQGLTGPAAASWVLRS